MEPSGKVWGTTKKAPFPKGTRPEKDAENRGKAVRRKRRKPLYAWMAGAARR
jgi:hypothetical protein